MSTSRSAASIGGAVPYDADANERANLAFQMTGGRYDEGKRWGQKMQSDVDAFIMSFGHDGPYVAYT